MIRSILCAAMVSFWFVNTVNGSVLHTVEIEPYCNTRLQSDAFLGSNELLPDGPVVFDGTPFGRPQIPFSRPSGGNNAWKGRYQINGDPHGPRLLDIDVNVYGATEVFTLLNTLCGEELPGTYASIEFYGSDGAFYERPLDGDNDIRNYLDSIWFTGNVNGTSTINVFTDGSGLSDETRKVRLDMQRFVLPSSFRAQTLDRIRLVDNGRTAPDYAPQRLLFTGVTVAAIPEPSSLIVWCLIGIAVGGIGWWRQAKR